jgi:hypothetical protein
MAEKRGRDGGTSKETRKSIREGIGRKKDIKVNTKGDEREGKKGKRGRRESKRDQSRKRETENGCERKNLEFLEMILQLEEEELKNRAKLNTTYRG